MKEPTRQGLMSTANRGDTPILNSLKSKFAPKKPLTLEQRLAQLSEMELKSLLGDAQMLQLVMYMKVKSGDLTHDYSTLYRSMYPRHSDYVKQQLLFDLLDQLAPLDFTPEPETKPDATTSYDLSEWQTPYQNPYDVNRIEQEAKERYAPKPESKEHSDFLNKLIQSESGGKADAEITIADGRRHVGKLQFSAARLSDYQNATGTQFTQDEFKADEELQDTVAAWHMADLNKAIDALGEDAAEYDRDGLRAVAHLGGKGGMRRFVESKGSYNPADELGTSLQSYYDKFSNGGGA